MWIQGYTKRRDFSVYHFIKLVFQSRTRRSDRIFISQNNPSSSLLSKNVMYVIRKIIVFKNRQNAQETVLVPVHLIDPETRLGVYPVGDKDGRR